MQFECATQVNWGHHSIQSITIVLDRRERFSAGSEIGEEQTGRFSPMMKQSPSSSDSLSLRLSELSNEDEDKEEDVPREDSEDEGSVSAWMDASLKVKQDGSLGGCCESVSGESVRS